jgi:ketosteroid isomerase-like protein
MVDRRGCEDKEGNAMTTTEEQEFAAFLRARATATAAFFNGDPEPWKAMASHSPDITMFGGFGGYERGWEAVSDRYTWAAAANAEGAVEAELIACHVAGEMAYTVAIERGAVRATGTTDFAPKALRVTEIFRKEDGAWRLVHRHADPLVIVRR